MIVSINAATTTMTTASIRASSRSARAIQLLDAANA